jgi:hypothetical protein
MTKTYCVIRRSNRNGGELTIARDIEMLAEAGELALRLLHLQETELGGADEFIAQPY